MVAKRARTPEQATQLDHNLYRMRDFEHREADLPRQIRQRRRGVQHATFRSQVGTHAVFLFLGHVPAEKELTEAEVRLLHARAQVAQGVVPADPVVRAYWDRWLAAAGEPDALTQAFDKTITVKLPCATIERVVARL